MLGVLDPHQIEEVLHGEVLGRIGCHAELTTRGDPLEKMEMTYFTSSQ